MHGLERNGTLAVGSHCGDDNLRKSGFFLLFLGLLLLMASAAQAQTQVDVAIGASGVKGTSANNAGTNFFPQDVGGGLFPSVSADFIFFKHFGVEGEVTGKPKRSLSQGFQPYRTVFYDVGAIYSPPLGKHAALELTAGAGQEFGRFYAPTLPCTFVTCTVFTDTDHVLWDLGAAIRIPAWHKIFIRPEVKAYFIPNNFEFSGDHAVRLGASIGYTFGK